MKFPQAVCLGLLAVAGYGLAFAVPKCAAGILVALPCIFLLADLPTPRKALYGGLLLGVAIPCATSVFLFSCVWAMGGAILFLIAGFPIAVFVLLLHLAP